jgi:hypothetical protein
VRFVCCVSRFANQFAALAFALLDAQCRQSDGVIVPQP